MVRFGLIGAGTIARKFATDIQVVEGAELVAVASRSIEKANKFADEFEIENRFGSYQELAQSDQIDAVYIALPHRFHKEQAIIFLENKKAVLCEKPMAVNKQEEQAMIDTAKKENTLLMEAMWTRYLPAINHLKKIIHSKELGEMLEMKLAFCDDFGLTAPIDGRHLNPNLAGGSLLDVGIYPISLLLYLTKEEFVYDALKYEFSATGVDMYVEIDMTLLNDVKTKVKILSGFDRQDKDAIITFEHGEVIVPTFFAAESIIINGEETKYPFESQGFEHEIRSFVTTYNNKDTENEVMTFNETIKIIEVLDFIREKIKLRYPFE